jgi:ATP-dependent protease ClpP protease subunit
MFKKLLLAVACVAFVVLSGLNVTNLAHKFITKPPAIIYVSGTVYGSTFVEFYEQTLDPSVRSYRVIINTAGGEGYATTGIVSRLQEMKDRGVHITTEVYSKAFSAGAFIFMMGDTRIVHQGAVLMWHTIIGQQVITDGKELERQHRLMIPALDENIIRLSTKNLPDVDPMTLETMLRWSGETYMTAAEALQLGIATHFVGT